MTAYVLLHSDRKRFGYDKNIVNALAIIVKHFSPRDWK